MAWWCSGSGVGLVINELRLRPVDHESDALTTTSPSHPYYITTGLLLLLLVLYYYYYTTIKAGLMIPGFSSS